MLKFFNKYYKENLHLDEKTKVILAISGGADSATMLDLYAKSHYACCIAHCNFQLRDNESDKDELFVEYLSKKHKLPYFKVRFDTKSYARQNGISIEMAARELRYQWFEELRQSIGYQYIATAHHQDDIIETFFINLLRGTGLRGLTGIKPISGHIIRPMLFTNHVSILNYCKNENLDFREDSTNTDVTIIRNKLRHLVIPLLKQVNQTSTENILKSIENLQESEKVFSNEIENAKKILNIENQGILKINIQKLKQLNPIRTYLFEMLRPYGFNPTQIKDIELILDSISGKTICSRTHKLIKDRDDLIVTPNEVETSFLKTISENDNEVLLTENQKLVIRKLKMTEGFKLPTETNIAALDLDKISFPLNIRQWEQGDSFFPLGMTQRKKLSDFFVNEKFSLPEKNQTLILLSENQIIWLIGKRIDNRFKITNETKNILLITLE
ncbi:MAG: tRNA lysidine(34) synthetase TilS [Bacteroidales bacterium]